MSLRAKLPVAIGQAVDFDAILLNLPQNDGFESTDFVTTQAIRLGNDWYDVDLVGKLFHDLDVQRTETVAIRTDEEEATMNAIVDDILTIQAAFVTEVAKRKT